MTPSVAMARVLLSGVITASCAFVLAEVAVICVLHYPKPVIAIASVVAILLVLPNLIAAHRLLRILQAQQ